MVVGFLLADIDVLSLGSVFQKRFIGEVIVKDDVGAFEGAAASQGDQVRIARSGADE